MNWNRRAGRVPGGSLAAQGAQKRNSNGHAATRAFAALAKQKDEIRVDGIGS